MMRGNGRTAVQRLSANDLKFSAASFILSCIPKNPVWELFGPYWMVIFVGGPERIEKIEWFNAVNADELQWMKTAGHGIFIGTAQGMKTMP